MHQSFLAKLWLDDKISSDTLQDSILDMARHGFLDRDLEIAREILDGSDAADLLEVVQTTLSVSHHGIDSRALFFIAVYGPKNDIMKISQDSQTFSDFKNLLEKSAVAKGYFCLDSTPLDPSKLARISPSSLWHLTENLGQNLQSIQNLLKSMELKNEDATISGGLSFFDFKPFASALFVGIRHSSFPVPHDEPQFNEKAIDAWFCSAADFSKQFGIEVLIDPPNFIQDALFVSAINHSESQLRFEMALEGINFSEKLDSFHFFADKEALWITAGDNGEYYGPVRVPVILIEGRLVEFIDWAADRAYKTVKHDSFHDLPKREHSTH